MYLIQKDGLWLLGFQPSTIREFVNGKLMNIYTGLWGSNKRDARIFDNKTTAETYADMVGGEVIEVVI